MIEYPPNSDSFSSSKEKSRNKRKPYEDSMAEAAVGTMRDILIELQERRQQTQSFPYYN